MHYFMYLFTAVVYKVTVITGDKWGAGTDANVHLVLFGDAGESDELKLNNSKNNFEKGK